MAITLPDPCPGGYGGRPILVPAPTIAVPPYGALTAYNVIDETDGHAANGIVYKSPACQGLVVPWVDGCDIEDLDPTEPTDDGRDSIVQGCPFHLYARLSCKTTTLAAMQDEVRTVFALGEPSAIEYAVWSNLIAQSDAIVLNTTPGTVGALGIVQSVAALESAISDCYPGEATIHADRGISAYASNALLFLTRGGSAYTPVGTPWALYGSNPNTGPDGSVAADGYAWMYATSRVTLRRFTTMNLPDFEHILNYPTNEPNVTVERTYVPSKECCSFAVLVSLEM